MPWIEQGVATGPVPGYYLSDLVALGDPNAEAAFDALNSYAGPSGHFPEALLYDDMSALQVYYDETGAIGDIAARLRAGAAVGTLRLEGAMGKRVAQTRGQCSGQRRASQGSKV